MVVFPFVPVTAAIGIRAGESAGKAVSVCGEVAGDPELTLALLALGVRRFSVSRPDYERVARRVEAVSLCALEPQRDALLGARTSGEVRRVLRIVQS